MSGQHNRRVLEAEEDSCSFSIEPFLTQLLHGHRSHSGMKVDADEEEEACAWRSYASISAPASCNKKASQPLPAPNSRKGPDGKMKVMSGFLERTQQKTHVSMCHFVPIPEPLHPRRDLTPTS